MRGKLILFLLAGIFFGACNNATQEEKPVREKNPVVTLNYQFINSYPHDIESFTEGLLMHNGQLYESTGATKNLPQTKSLFGTLDLESGKISPKVVLDREQYFGEGITFLKDKIFQLTYDTKVGFIYDAKTFKKIDQFALPTSEGWGMTTDGKNLIMSDGSNTLTYLDPENLKVVKRLTVTENGAVRNYLNELEYINGFIFANIYTTRQIVKIDPSTGNVVGKLDLSLFVQEAKSLYSGSLELNGIAYDSVTNNVYVTGKLWPKIYEIKISN